MQHWIPHLLYCSDCKILICHANDFIAVTISCFSAGFHNMCNVRQSSHKRRCCQVVTPTCWLCVNDLPYLVNGSWILQAKLKRWTLFKTKHINQSNTQNLLKWEFYMQFRMLLFCLFVCCSETLTQWYLHISRITCYTVSSITSHGAKGESCS